MKTFYKYNNYLLKQNMKDSSIYLYIYYLRKFLKWHEEVIKTPFKELKKSIIKKYIKSISLNISENSINNYINFFKSYNNFLINEGIQNEMVVDNSLRVKISKVKVKKNNYIDEKYIENLLQQICCNDGIKNYTMLSLIAYSGLRTTEVIELKLKDLNFDERIMNITGSYERKVPMNSNIENSLKLYLKEIYTMEEYLFINERGTKYTTSGLRWIFRKNCPYNKVTLSTLRDFYKLKLKEQGYIAKEIDELLGYTTKHKSYTDKKLKEMLTPSEFAKIFSVAPITVIKWCDKGLVKAYRTDKGFRKIPYSEVKKLRTIR
ncbi:tyrosine-type recombinase/integrase [Clostridium scatologenes]|uniref:Site-specific recombinase, phage integrase family n=1 Tax=Clostridium scatologenes TaxID=1548 RepID=A0A0E3M860_CLOSL|nr:tyrosine-type recombinase/integrase [Clostridium scatologenes]AKA68413.1 site-specific recombinase, phage integrase family [Clostridium scatologenes]